MTEARETAIKERRFQCQNCGLCCSHKGLILPNETNMQELAKFLRMSEWSFAIRYLQEIYDPKLDAYIIAFKTSNTNDPKNGCIFHFGSFCAIYSSCRTDLCQIFPWNHFNVEKSEWDPGFVRDDGTFWCHGIGQGREWGIEEIRELKAKYTNLGVGFRRQLEK